MSKAFTKEDDGAGEAPALRRRATLPAGVPNYVTPGGWRALRAELDALNAAIAPNDGAPLAAVPAEAERRGRASVELRRRDLEARIASAVVVSNEALPPHNVRFGAEVQVQNADGRVHRYRIVGVDEADPARGLLAFVSPVARALLGRRVGEVAPVRTPHHDGEVRLLAIAYPDDSAGADET